MKTKRIIPAIGLAMCVFGGVATAASVDFNMGANYGNAMSVKYQQANGKWKTVNDAGGNFGSFAGRKGAEKGAVLDGVKLTFAYCIDLYHSVRLNGKYTATTNPDAIFADRGRIDNAEKVAWLITKQARTATTLDKQAGLQAAIWEQVHGDKFELLATGAIRTAYDGYMAALGNNVADVNSVIWIDPYSGKVNSKNPLGATSNQDIVAMVTPIPGAVWLFGSALVGLIGLGKRKGQKTVVAM